MHVYGDAYIYGQHSIFPASNSAFIFNDLVRVSTADQFTQSCNMAILNLQCGGWFQTAWAGYFSVNMLCSKLSLYLTIVKNFQVSIFICSVRTRKYLGFSQFLHYLCRRTGTGSPAGRKCRSAVHGTDRHIPIPSRCLFPLPHQCKLHTNHILSCHNCTQCHEINLYQFRSCSTNENWNVFVLCTSRPECKKNMSIIEGKHFELFISYPNKSYTKQPCPKSPNSTLSQLTITAVRNKLQCFSRFMQCCNSLSIADLNA